MTQDRDHIVWSTNKSYNLTKQWHTAWKNTTNVTETKEGHSSKKQLITLSLSDCSNKK